MRPGRMPARPLLALAICCAALIGVVGATLPFGASGEGPIVVNSTADTDVADSACTLREAIVAANTDADPYNGCTGAGAATDEIAFNLGASMPAILIASALPDITDSVSINGATGGSQRVELRGPGGGTQDLGFEGLRLMSGADGSAISNLVIDSFPGWGIRVDAPNVTIAGNRIGTNAPGGAARPNYGGIHADDDADNLRVGSPAGTTFGGACTGGCNLLSGNTTNGVELVSGVTNAVIQANYAGVNVDGDKQLANGTFGVFSNGASGTLIGGGGTGEGNVLSGNGFMGAMMIGPGAVARGNRIGTNAAGTAAIGNSSDGIELTTAPGGIIKDNLISGNGDDGIDVADDQTGATIVGNLVGVALDGVTPLTNGGPGVDVPNASHVIIGGTGAGEANTIAYNIQGVLVRGPDAPTVGNTTRGNSIHHNTEGGILLWDNGNLELTPPVIATSGPLHGTACANCIIDIYSDTEGQGEIYEGATQADAGGQWTVGLSLSGPNITATATDADGNTSEFSAPIVLADLAATPSPSLTPPASTTPTPTTTPPRSASPTRTATPVLTALQGDGDCDGDIDLADVRAILSDAAGLANETPCIAPAEGNPLDTSNPRDTDCDGEVTGLDAFEVLLDLGGLPQVSVPEDCAAVGEGI
jgi:CSLREA domain-containing protein